MATIITKNSTTPGNVPGTIVQGELAINTADGKLFYGSGSVAKEYSASLAITASYITGSVFNSSNPVLSASYALTASHALNGGGGGTPGGANTTIQFNDSNTFSGSGNFTFTKATNTVKLSGSLQVTGSINVSSSIYFSTATDAGVATTGQVGWNTGDQTLDIGLSGSAGNIPILQIGQQQVARVHNSQGVPLIKGQVVYISGSTGNRVSVKLASATNDANSAGTLGFVLDTIPTGGEGYITTEGPLYKLNTIGYNEGELIYLSSSAGQYTHTKPVAPLHEVRLGFIERVHATVGSIYVKVDNGYEIGELHDVLDTTTTSSYGDLLVKSGSVWLNSKQLTGSYGITGSLTISGSLTTNDGVSITSLTASFVSASSITGSLFGTSSWATNALTASFLPVGTYNITSSWAQSASNAVNAQTASFLPIGTYAITSSWAVSASQAITASFVPNSFATDIGNGTLTTINVTHGLGTRDVHVTVYSASGDFATVICDVFRSSSLNDIRLVFANAPATNEYRVVVSK